MPTDAFSYVDSPVAAGGKSSRRAELPESCHSPEKDCAEEGGKALALEAALTTLEGTSLRTLEPSLRRS